MSQNSPQKWFQLEEHFFKGVDQDLLKKLRGDLEKAETAEQIMQVAGIQNAELAREIADLNVTVETLAAFRLAPVVVVAWADDRVENNERYHITKAAEKSGIDSDDPAMELLKSWTERRPPSDLMDAWCQYAAALTSSLAEAHRSSLKEEMVGLVKAVAEANGGLLGFASVSPSESEVLKQVEEALS
ncbi:MAG: hypothetical protein AAGG44_18970 [Planctomycetota bacterium]